MKDFFEKAKTWVKADYWRAAAVAGAGLVVILIVAR